MPHSAYLETLCDYLYDDLRPRILHESRLEALCEVCTVLQALMVLDVPGSESLSSEEEEGEGEGGENRLRGDSDSDDDQDEGEEDELTVDFTSDPHSRTSSIRSRRDGGSRNGNGNKNKKGLNKLHISHLLQMILQDAQTRLFFKAQSVVQSEVKYYVPKKEDLAYPGRLVGAGECSCCFLGETTDYF